MRQHRGVDLHQRILAAELEVLSAHEPAFFRLVESIKLNQVHVSCLLHLNLLLGLAELRLQFLTAQEQLV